MTDNAELLAVNAFPQSLLDAFPSSVALVDAKGIIRGINVHWERMVADGIVMLSDAVLGADSLKAFAALDSNACVTGESAVSSILAVISGATPHAAVDFRYQTSAGLCWFKLHVSTVAIETPPGALVTLLDITESTQAKQELFRMAHYDRLTGLPNRMLLLDRLGNCVALAKRKQMKSAVIFLNINRFRAINDSLGHEAGDQLLRAIGERFVETVRDSDSVGHLGGDEFAVIVAELPDDSEAAVVVRRLISGLEMPFPVNGQQVMVTASAGIATCPDDADDAETLLRIAETAMTRAKAAGGNCYQYYMEAMNDGVLARLRLDAELRQALFKNEFELFYQPKVSCTNGEIVGTEALLRWHHPKRGVISPVEFVGVLEETGLIKEVGKWALNTACRQLKQWIDLGLGRPTVAVNISAIQLQGNELLEAVHAALTETGLPADRLELELTESVLMRDVEHVISTLQALRELGVRFSVDDFGTGYSSLAYLKRFPIDAVKIDRSFVQDITTNPDDASIARAVINMAHNLKLKVIAEGVETEGQLSLLMENHCDQIQGFFFSKPLPAAEMEQVFADRGLIPALPIQAAERQRTILLVDDEENILASLRRLLRRDGYRILTANGGAAGLEILATNEVDVIVSDQRMPGMTGVEFLRRVKTIHPDTVRMVLSGYTELQSITDAINEGAIYKFLTKPWEDDLLRANIEEAFRYKELADENRRLNAEIKIANQELAEANMKLRGKLAEREMRIEQDETSLGIAHEILQSVPFPVLGFDDDGMVAFSNQEAEKILGGGKSLLGAMAQSALPETLFNLIEKQSGDTFLWNADPVVWQALYKRLDGYGSAKGRLLILMLQPTE